MRCNEEIEVEQMVFLCNRVKEHKAFNRHRAKEEIINTDNIIVMVTVEWD